MARLAAVAELVWMEVGHSDAPPVVGEPSLGGMTGSAVSRYGAAGAALPLEWPPSAECQRGTRRVGDDAQVFHFRRLLAR
jgi:hypothetical protein